MQYVKLNQNGAIECLYDGNAQLDGFVPAERTVLHKYGVFYFEGDAEPLLPAPTLAEAQAAKRTEINAGFDAAMTASLTMPSASTPASAFAVYQAIEAWKTEDPEGYSTLLTIHEARRASLLSAVDAAATPEAVQAISVTYAV